MIKIFQQIAFWMQAKIPHPVDCTVIFEFSKMEDAYAAHHAMCTADDVGFRTVALSKPDVCSKLMGIPIKFRWREAKITIAAGEVG